jgi:ribulose-phosphate 3-epimerase
MDGHFVPNLTMGPLVVAALRRATSLPLDVHLMTLAPERLIDAFAGAGADIITVHQEACVHLHRTIEQIHSLGRRAGVAINPATPVSTLDEILPYIELILMMSVNPGFGGQKFIRSSPQKITTVSRKLRELGLGHVEIEVDGGISPDTARCVAEAGASVLVAGAAVFNDAGSVAQNMARLRASLAPDG